MGRPQKNNCNYFSHDNDMRNDDKIRAVRRKFGHQGYAIWNMLLEVLCKSEHFVLQVDVIKTETMSGDFDIDSATLIQMIEYFCNINLLQKYGDCYFCSNLVKRLFDVLNRRNEVFVDENIYPKELLHTLTQLNVVTVNIKPQSKVNKIELNNSECGDSEKISTHTQEGLKLNGTFNWVECTRQLMVSDTYKPNLLKKYSWAAAVFVDEMHRFVLHVEGGGVKKIPVSEKETISQYEKFLMNSYSNPKNAKS